jgi:hypothetical protein
MRTVLKDIQERIRARRRTVRFAFAAAGAVALVAVIWGILLLNPVPPRTVTMTTGGRAAPTTSSGSGIGRSLRAPA